MPSPVPGMDPYLEKPAEWGGFHLGMCYAIQAELNRHLPGGLRAKLDQYLWVQDAPAGGGASAGRPVKVKPDAFVPEGQTGGNGVAVAARPVTAPTTRGRLPAGRKKKARRVLVTAGGDRVLTAVEVLSYSNKLPGDDRDAYLRKRREYLASVDLVEVDLLRAGERMPAGEPLPPPSDYLMFACRTDHYPAVETWAVTVRDELPVLPVPLGPDFPPCPLDLRACLDRVYEDTRAALEIDYAGPPPYPLRPADAAWAADLLEKRKR